MKLQKIVCFETGNVSSTNGEHLYIQGIKTWKGFYNNFGYLFKWQSSLEELIKNMTVSDKLNKLCKNWKKNLYKDLTNTINKRFFDFSFEDIKRLAKLEFRW